MYKRKMFRSMDELLNFLNFNKKDIRIIAIIPVNKSGEDDISKFNREYEMVYREFDTEWLRNL